MIHCAAHVGGIVYDEMHPVEIFEDNLTIGLNTVKAVAENNIRCLINMIPNCTYPAQFDEYKEETWWDGAMHPSVVVYGLPRKMMEVACFAYLKKFDFRAAHIVFPNLYGPGDHFDPIRSHALGALIAKIVNAKRNGKKSVEILCSVSQPPDSRYSVTAVTSRLPMSGSICGMNVAFFILGTTGFAIHSSSYRGW